MITKGDAADACVETELSTSIEPSKNGTSWESRVIEKVERITSQLPDEFIHPELVNSLEDTTSVMDIPERYLSDKEITITSLDAVSLVDNLARGCYTSVEVLNSFVHRAAIAHRLLRCCLDFPYRYS